MTHTETLRLALEALEKISRTQYHIETPPIESLEEKMRRIADKAIIAIKAALEAKAEAWEKFCDSHCVRTDHHPDCKLAQRTWVGLTLKEIESEWGLFMSGQGSGYIPDFAKALETKLKEKNT